MDTTPYKTPNDKKRPRPLNGGNRKKHYKWTEQEKNIVKEGANKGWKETKIKTNYFKDGGPSKSQIKTLLEKLTTKGNLSDSGLNNIPKFPQSNTIGKFLLKKKLI